MGELLETHGGGEEHNRYILSREQLLSRRDGGATTTKGSTTTASWREEVLKSGEGEELRDPSNTVVEEERGGSQTSLAEIPHALGARAVTQKLITQFTGYKAKGEMARCKDCAALFPEGEVHTW